MAFRAFVVALFPAGAAFADVLCTAQATAAADAPLHAEHRTGCPVIATIPANSSITLITGPYNASFRGAR